MTKNIFLGLGSNFGNRLNNLKNAISLIDISDNVRIIKYSSIYETEPWGIKEQPGFLNMVVEIETDLNAYELMKYLKECEVKAGRIKREKWKEREIDIDILFIGDMVINRVDFTIPHKEIQNRRFVLEPLNEIAGGFIHPVSGICFWTVRK